MEATMAHAIRHHTYHDDSWSHALYRAAIIGLALAAAAAFYVLYDGSNTTAGTDAALPVLPPMFPLIPLM
jgi:hypothetical protein